MSSLQGEGLSHQSELRILTDLRCGGLEASNELAAAFLVALAVDSFAAAAVGFSADLAGVPPVTALGRAGVVDERPSTTGALPLCVITFALALGVCDVAPFCAAGSLAAVDVDRRAGVAASSVPRADVSTGVSSSS